MNGKELNELQLKLTLAYGWGTREFEEICEQAQFAIIQLLDELETVKAERDALRTGDTCARHCEGQAYRIEARRLKRELEKANAQIEEMRKDEPVAWMHTRDPNYVYSTKIIELWGAANPKQVENYTIPLYRGPTLPEGCAD